MFLFFNLHKENMITIAIENESLFLRLFVCMHPIYVRTAEPIGPNFLWKIEFFEYLSIKIRF